MCLANAYAELNGKNLLTHTDGNMLKECKKKHELLLFLCSVCGAWAHSNVGDFIFDGLDFSTLQIFQ